MITYLKSPPESHIAIPPSPPYQQQTLNINTSTKHVYANTRAGHTPHTRHSKSNPYPQDTTCPPLHNTSRRFNRDILLKCRTNNGIPTPSTTTTKNGPTSHKLITSMWLITHRHLQDKGGHNYTSTSHIDGFYTNFPHTPSLICHTITNFNQNSDHYPVQFQLNPNSIVIKDHTALTNLPRITYPIPTKILQILHTTFLEKQNLAIENITRTFQQEHLTHIQWEIAQTTLQENHQLPKSMH